MTHVRYFGHETFRTPISIFSRLIFHHRFSVAVFIYSKYKNDNMQIDHFVWLSKYFRDCKWCLLVAFCFFRYMFYNTTTKSKKWKKKNWNFFLHEIELNAKCKISILLLLLLLLVIRRRGSMISSSYIFSSYFCCCCVCVVALMPYFAYRARVGSWKMFIEPTMILLSWNENFCSKQALKKTVKTCEPKMLFSSSIFFSSDIVIPMPWKSSKRKKKTKKEEFFRLNFRIKFIKY